MEPRLAPDGELVPRLSAVQGLLELWAGVLVRALDLAVDHQWLALVHAGHGPADGRDRVGQTLAPGRLVVEGHGSRFVRVLDLVELDAQVVADAPQGALVPAAPDVVVEHRRAEVERLVEAPVDDGQEAAVTVQVANLGDVDAVDPPGAREQAEEVPGRHVARVGAAAEDRAVPLLAGCGDRQHELLAPAPRCDQVHHRWPDDVGAAFEEGHHVGNAQRLALRIIALVDEAVGLQVKQGLDVVGGDDSRLARARDVAGVTTDLVGSPGVQPDQLVFGVADQAPKARHSDRAGAPCNHALLAHAVSSRLKWPRIGPIC